MNIYKSFSLSSRYNSRHRHSSFIPRAVTLTCFATPPPQKPSYLLFILAAIAIKFINDNDNGPSDPSQTLNTLIEESFHLKDFKTR